uniref:Histone-lysine N-methyltransferase SETMAR n=1 Tax=Oreochromis aureus TaxID=47969 RepID=A0AAZ1X9I8_OREAU
FSLYRVLLVDFLPVGTTINADRYCETLGKLRRTFQKRRRGMLSKGVSILHDTASPHVARQTVALLQNFGWNIITHPPYSPDFTPSDYHLLTIRNILSQSDAEKLVHAFITSRLDYCNSLLSGSPKNSLKLAEKSSANPKCCSKSPDRD